MKFLEIDGRYINIDKIISVNSGFCLDGTKFTTIKCENQEYFDTEIPIENILARLAELTGNGG
ncbi:hypothetical protein Javan425_0036 [Streptococcus phage Javan425]|uniref:Phage protein n=1 Tax=Streptococcus porcinus str. Jelinkova 176 TaxID=873448 RepID=A0ABN0CUF0_STRPO|nr:hypothetical protein [Streptococcus porcinus]EGJ26875.1 hypothetical protein STRPO_0268 [Streptococcus porcinus str. Jelinkova 176]QBX18370.1 hypothetical protein Javan423_0024 [Streptococcus phage Javan423]QBX18441.1 hypothetical protein Javan425_0036 [Streptococcus phage Javan425]SQG43959.1 Uncharacterised protein [Streptococcus porcinus]